MIVCQNGQKTVIEKSLSAKNKCQPKISQILEILNLYLFISIKHLYSAYDSGKRISIYSIISLGNLCLDISAIFLKISQNSQILSLLTCSLKFSEESHIWRILWWQNRTHFMKFSHFLQKMAEYFELPKGLAGGTIQDPKIWLDVFFCEWPLE